MAEKNNEWMKSIDYHTVLHVIEEIGFRGIEEDGYQLFIKLDSLLPKEFFEEMNRCRLLYMSVISSNQDTEITATREVFRLCLINVLNEQGVDVSSEKKTYEIATDYVKSWNEYMDEPDNYIDSLLHVSKGKFDLPITKLFSKMSTMGTSIIDGKFPELKTIGDFFRLPGNKYNSHFSPLNLKQIRKFFGLGEEFDFPNEWDRKRALKFKILLQESKNS